MSRKKKKESIIRTRIEIELDLENIKFRIDNFIIGNQPDQVWVLLDKYIDLKTEIARLEMNENKNL